MAKPQQKLASAPKAPKAPRKTRGKGKEYSKDEAGRSERFKDFGVKRVAKALKAVKQIANLSNKASYHYTDEQVTKMFAAIRNELDTAEKRFSGSKSADAEFTFE